MYGKVHCCCPIFMQKLMRLLLGCVRYECMSVFICIVYACMFSICLLCIVPCRYYNYGIIHGNWDND